MEVNTASGLLLQGELLSLEGDGLVEGELLEDAPAEGLSDLSVVVVLAVGSNEIVNIDDDNGHQLPIAVLKENHLVKGVLLVANLFEPGNHSKCPQPGRVAEPVDVGTHQVESGLPAIRHGSDAVGGGQQAERLVPLRVLDVALQEGGARVAAPGCQLRPLSSNSLLWPATITQNKMCSEVLFGVAHSRLRRKMSGSLCPNATTRYFGTNSASPRLLSRKQLRVLRMRFERILSLSTCSASACDKGLTDPHSSQLFASFTAAALKASMSFSFMSKILRQGISRSKALASALVSGFLLCFPGALSSQSESLVSVSAGSLLECLRSSLR